MMKLYLLLTKGFLAGLALLILNDFFLKQYAGNWLTGKLSDFAGLFIFPIFLTAFFPGFIRANYVFTFLFFIYWKTGLSTPLFSVLALNGLHLHRIIDYTDFIAFISLPFSYGYIKNITVTGKWEFNRWLAYVAGIIAFFSFSATSARKHNNYNQVYIDVTCKSKLSKTAFLDSIRTNNIIVRVDTAQLGLGKDTLYIAEIPNLSDTVLISEKTSIDDIKPVGVKFSIKERRKGSEIHLEWVRFDSAVYTLSNNYNKLQRKGKKLAKQFLIEAVK